MAKLFNIKSACTGCGACAAVCPSDAVKIIPDAEGFLYPVTDQCLCTNCGRCESVCQTKTPAEGMDGRVFAVRCKEMDILKRSSSGGAFFLMADKIIREGGLVCGAVFDEHFVLHHVISDTVAPMMKAKYVQSDLTEIYASIKTALTERKKILFTGTPCQCDAVRRYCDLNCEADCRNLILAALICRGVQSPGLWADYVSWLDNQGGLESYCFRDKRVMNDAHTVAFTIGGKETAVHMNTDPFSRLYLKCLTLRPSCYHCQYSRWETPFDITFGDFWGIEKTHPELNDGAGTSLVIARTSAGMELVTAMEERAIVIESTKEDAMQPALCEPAKETILRKILFRDYAQKNAQGHCDIPLILKKYGG